MDDTDYIVLYAKPGQSGETAFILPQSPKVKTSDSSVVSSFSNDTLLLNYTLSGLKVVDITSGAAKIRVLLMDRDTAGQWHTPILPGKENWSNYFSIGSNSSILVGGPYLVREASVLESTLLLVGDVIVSEVVKTHCTPEW